MSSEEASDPNDEPPVTAEKPESAISVTGTDHISIIGSNEADTVDFYRDILGMPLVLRQPNLDDPSMTHLFFDTGDGRMLTFFVSDQPSNRGGQRPGVGAVHHLAFSVDAEQFGEIKDALSEEDIQYNEFNRGAFHSLYTTDHNGLVIELATDKYDIPDDRRGEALATAQRIRVAAGASYVEDEHLAAALDELEIDSDPVDLGEADAGVGGI